MIEIFEEVADNFLRKAVAILKVITKADDIEVQRFLSRYGTFTIVCRERITQQTRVPIECRCSSSDDLEFHII